ncbi:MAG TPA: dienelactone hydrolase family protein [Hyphomicrobiales bacterium]|nr:dienelactone hydrolase family protein [Hyphomicrobiales bacterium]
MPGQTFDYHDGATLLEAYVALPATEQAERPAVLVCHAWGGRGDFECAAADKLAALGYVGIALDVYGKGVRGRNNEENSRLMQPLLDDRALLRRRLLAGVEAAARLPMVDTPRMAAIGFCFGGLCVLDLARSGADLRGVVSFHGLFTPAAELPSATIKAKVLALHGHDDPMSPPDQVQALAQELSAANVDWQIHVYGGTRHAFTNPEAQQPELGLLYNAVSAQRAWQNMQSFLSETLE